MKTIEVPELIREHCRRFKGLYVPFTALWATPTTPDFKTTDTQKVLRCVTKSLCGICGQYMDAAAGPVCFLGGPLSMENRLFTDPGMHEACARYSAQVCPFLAGKIVTMQEHPKHGSINYHVSTVRPDKIGLLKTESYRLAQDQDGNYYIHAASGKVEYIA